jgi:hypothetical protein
MFPKDFLTKLQTLVSKRASGATEKEFGRRAIDMIPDACNGRDISFFDPAKYQQLILAAEGDQKSFCLKVVSASRRFRCAVLIFRGRVLGCIFGSKRWAQQLFGKPAYEQMLAEMSPDSMIQACALDERLVLAAGSLFHSEAIKLPANSSLLSNFTSAYNQLVQGGRPGNIVVNDENGFTVVTVYFFNGELIGVYSHIDGWLSTSYEAAVRCVRQLETGKVFASRLYAKDMQQVLPLTFALSRLGESQLQQRNTGTHNLDGLLVRIKPVERTVLSGVFRFFPGGAQSDADRAGRNSGRFTRNW